MEISMNSMKIGDIAQVIRLNLTGRIRQRLQDIGLIEGTRIQCTLKSPSGDPKAFLIRGAVMAIRSEDCENVRVIIHKEPITPHTY